MAALSGTGELYLNINVKRGFDSYGSKTLMVKPSDPLDAFVKDCEYVNGIDKIPQGCYVEILFRGTCISDYIANNYRTVHDLEMESNDNVYIKVYNSDNQMCKRADNGDWYIYQTPSGRKQKRPNF